MRFCARISFCLLAILFNDYCCCLNGKLVKARFRNVFMHFFVFFVLLFHECHFLISAVQSAWVERGRESYRFTPILIPACFLVNMKENDHEL